jgi:hypothetical protein
MSVANTPATTPRLLAAFSERSGEVVWADVVAAGRKSAAFRRWIDELSAQGYPALTQLRRDGFIDDLGLLETELRRALQKEPVGPLTQMVGQRLLDLLAAHRDSVCLFLEEG